MKKRYRAKKVKPGQLCVYYGKLPHDAPDIIYHSGEGVPSCDRALMHLIFGCSRPPEVQGRERGKSLIDELAARGYDLSTLQFSIQKSPNA